MTRELIIEGQQVDLAPDTDITLEYNGNVLGDIGKITLSHSYTIKIPRTARNARILDDPDNLGHASGATRRFLNARFFRNGIDLIGPALAYILKTSPEGYEIALVWNTLEALQILSQSSASLNDLPNLPVLTWIGPNGTAPDYTGGNDKDGALFAFYNSGLGNVMYPAVDTATHPSYKIAELIDGILKNASIPYDLSSAALLDVNNIVILCAPKHAPNRMMEIESGSCAGRVGLFGQTVNGRPSTRLYLGNWTHGWDALSTITGENSSFSAANSKYRVMLNIQADNEVDLSGIYVIVKGFNSKNGILTNSSELLRAYFKSNDYGWFIYFDEEINASGWDYISLSLGNTLDYRLSVEMQAYDQSQPMAALNIVHSTLTPSKDNRFPIQGNLPDIKQWDFIKACMAMFGWAAVIQNGSLHILTYSELLNISNAYDWTEKVDMTDGGLKDIEYKLNGWAQQNWLTYKEDTPVGFDPNASIDVDDFTLAMSRDLFELPFAASMQSDAPHYKVDGTKVDDVNIEPRIFEIVDKSGVRTLEFTERLYGQSLVSAHYERLQEIVRKPIAISVNIRLHEIDLAQLDLTRPVYLGQFGHYYMIQKIQTSKIDLCKVSLIQLA